MPGETQKERNRKMDERANGSAKPEDGFRPVLRYYHANGKGTGSAMEFELHPAHGRTAGSIFASIARQKTVGAMSEGSRVFPTFDWKEKACVKLDIADLCEMLQVFRGMQESIADGKGLFHRTSSASTSIKLSHVIEPRPGYLLEVWRNPVVGDAWGARMLFSVSEALGLSLAIEQSMGVVAFGMPKVVPRGMAAAGACSAADAEPDLDVAAVI